MLASASSIATRYAPVLLLALFWELVTRLGIVSPQLLPPVSSIFVAGARLFSTNDIYHQAAVSLLRAFSGLGFAVVFGVTIGILMARLPIVRVIVNPIVQMFYPLPKSALIPVMIIWLGVGSISKVVLIFIGCMVPVIISTFNGARGVDEVLIWSARSLGASPRAILREVILPSAMPQILGGIRIALATSFLLLVSSELLISNDGLGYYIGILGENGSYPTMFAVIFIVIAIGFGADRIYLQLMNRMIAWAQ
jgi:ABC-type nitrate/sulfonate/bicarbonate transport system permease component